MGCRGVIDSSSRRQASNNLIQVEAVFNVFKIKVCYQSRKYVKIEKQLLFCGQGTIILGTVEGGNFPFA